MIVGRYLPTHLRLANTTRVYRIYYIITLLCRARANISEIIICLTIKVHQTSTELMVARRRLNFVCLYVANIYNVHKNIC